MMRNRKATGRAVAFLLQCRAAEEKSAACFFVVDALDGLVQPGMPGLCFLRLARRHLLLSCAESAVGAGKNRLTAKVDIGRPSGRMRRTGFRIRRRRDFHGPVRFSDGKTEPNELFNLAELLVLVNAAEGNCSSSASCTSGAADSMNIGFRLHGKIIVDDVRETFNIQAAGGNIGRHQNAAVSGLELCQRTCSCSDHGQCGRIRTLYGRRRGRW